MGEDVFIGAIISLNALTEQLKNVDALDGTVSFSPGWRILGSAYTEPFQNSSTVRFSYVPYTLVPYNYLKQFGSKLSPPFCLAKNHVTINFKR